jgi:hypothetical protein
LEGFGKETESNEGSEETTPPFRALRGENLLYVEYDTGERELYNLRDDPYQISNIAHEAPNTVLREYSQRLDQLARCAGRDCARIEDESAPEPGPAGIDLGGSKRDRSSSRSRDAASADADGGNVTTGIARRQRVGGDSAEVAQFQVDVPSGAGSADQVQLRVFVTAVDNPGTLVAALEPASGESRNRERLDGVPVAEKGWITLDVADALGDSGPLTLSLRARDGAELTIASVESGKTPQLVPASDTAQATRDAKTKANDQKKAKKTKKKAKKAKKAKKKTKARERKTRGKRDRQDKRDGRDRERQHNRAGHDRRQ